MIAFSLSRLAFAGFAAALLLALGASFLTGWLAALSQPPVAELRAIAAAKVASDKQLAEAKSQPQPAQVESKAQPVAAPAQGAAAPAPAATPAAAAPTEPAAAPPAAKPETALAAAMAQPTIRLAAPPAPTAAPAAESPGMDDGQRSQPRELNAEYGRIGDPLRPVYTVEAGLFTAHHVADALYQRLEAERYDVYRVDGGEFGVAIRVGAFDDRRLAEAAAVELRARQGVDARVLRAAPAMMAELARAKREPH